MPNDPTKLTPEEREALDEYGDAVYACGRIAGAGDGTVPYEDSERRRKARLALVESFLAKRAQSGGNAVPDEAASDGRREPLPTGTGTGDATRFQQGPQYGDSVEVGAPSAAPPAAPVPDLAALRERWQEAKQYARDIESVSSAARIAHEVGDALLGALEARPTAEDYSAAWECLDMVREKLEALGTDMKGTPPMFYPEAIQATLYRWCKRALAGELEEREGKIAALERGAARA